MKLLSVAHLFTWLLLASSAAPLEAQFAEVAKLLASDGAAGDDFGNSVAISGDRALVGALLDDDLGLDSGSAYVFEREAGGAWTALAKLVASDGAAGDAFGSSVSISGDYALVGAAEDDDLGPGSGSAYVFERDVGGTWTEVAKLNASDGAASDHFGRAVSVSGDRALVGSWFIDFFGLDSGSAYVFERTEGGTWTEVAKLEASDGTAFDDFGKSVSVSEDHALVGATDRGDGSGAAYVFERDAQGSWMEVAKLVASDAATDDYFGESVSISGDRALVGAWGVGAFAGSAYVFERDPGGTWTQVAELVPGDIAAGDNFGFSVSISEDRALVGARGDFDLISSSGSAYVFERNAGGTWTELAKLKASEGHSVFGSVAISEGRALVGTAGDAGLGVSSGSAYVFEPCSARLLSTEVVRLGSPPNPGVLLPGLSSGPILGSTWDPIIDHTSFLTDAVVDFLGITANPLNVHVPPFGTLLCDPALTVAIATASAGVPFAVLVPGDCAYVGVSVCTQGASIALSGTLLFTNALDITLGTF